MNLENEFEPQDMKFAFYRDNSSMQIELIEGNRTEGKASSNISLGGKTEDYDEIRKGTKQRDSDC